MPERFKTPWLECMYPFLQVPKHDNKGDYEDAFEITLVLSDQVQEHKNLLNQIAALHNEGGGTQEIGEKKHPIKKAVDDNKKVIPHTYHVRFKSLAEYCDHIPTFDAQGNKILRERNFVANGSVVCVNWSYGFYKQGGGGVSLFLNGVQIKELIEWMGNSAEDLGFEKTEGYNEFDKPVTDGMTEPPENDKETPDSDKETPDSDKESTKKAQSESQAKETKKLPF
jgi:hypothetical protein